MDDKHKMINLPEAARRSGIKVSTLRAAARTGALKSEKVGRDWLTTEAYVDEWNRTRKIGRPRKKQV